MRVMILALFMTGCTVSFQPFPSVTKKEFGEAVTRTNENIKILAEKLNELSKKQGENQ